MSDVTPAAFRLAFPPFANTAVYPDAMLTFWFGLSDTLMDPARWGTSYAYGQQLFVAHNLSLAAMSAGGAATGQAPGQISGPVTSAGVDKVNYSRDPSAAMNKDAGHWNLTTYGLQYVYLMKMIGAGPVQVGVPPGENNWPYQGAWPGVIYGPW